MLPESSTWPTCNWLVWIAGKSFLRAYLLSLQPRCSLSAYSLEIFRCSLKTSSLAAVLGCIWCCLQVGHCFLEATLNTVDFQRVEMNIQARNSLPIKTPPTISYLNPWEISYNSDSVKLLWKNTSLQAHILYMAPRYRHQAEFLEVLNQHNKAIQRLGWKNMDSEEFSETYLAFLKDLGNVTKALRKSDLMKALSTTKLTITMAEAELLARKVKDAISYCRRRIRDSGSGKRLPRPVLAMIKIWSRTSQKKVSRVNEKPMEPAKMEKEPPKKLEKQSLRDIFGLGKAQKAPCVDLIASGAASSAVPSSSAGSCQKQPNHPSSAIAKNPSLQNSGIFLSC